MTATSGTQIEHETWIRRHAVLAYFTLTLSISWAGAFAVAAPYVIRRTPIPTFAGILIFPAMLLGPLVSGFLMAGITGGRRGIKAIFAGMNPARIAPVWYTALLIPPALILPLLLLLEHTVSPAFAPNHFWLGVAFGVPAGLFEEIGWSGFAFPQMRRSRSGFPAAILLGILWSLWHLPAINFLGASAPHGQYWFVFFFAFAFAMTAMRVLISWLLQNTGSVLLAQLMHISSTGALVIFSPPVSTLQESLWYAVYGLLLWLVVAGVVCIFGRQLRRQNLPSSADGP